MVSARREPRPPKLLTLFCALARYAFDRRDGRFVANFDIALYPRRVDHSPMPVKLAEYMGLGIPTVSYDLELAKPLYDAGAGVLAKTPRDFVEAVERLARDDQQRQRMGREAAAAGAALDWTRLAERYQTEVFERYLC